MKWYLGAGAALLLLHITLMNLNMFAKAVLLHLIAGRAMVGLRWWNYVDDDGKSHWVFEARKVGVIS
jgi:hypothetical protein